MLKWQIQEKEVFGTFYYSVYRLKSVCAVDESDNREYKGKLYTDKAEAQAFADELNRREAERNG